MAGGPRVCSAGATPDTVPPVTDAPDSPALAGRNLLVAVGGGIAAYKAVLLVRALQERGASVRVAMTRAATRFVGPVTFTGLTGTPALTELWDPNYAGELHVELGAWADAIVVCPATMNLLARAAHGHADDVVLATLSCATGPVLYAPAMHARMWAQPATQRAVALLAEAGATFAGPTVGRLASGEKGAGRLAEPEDVADAVVRVLHEASRKADMSGRQVLVSAGPTYEDLDPVRYLGNRASGKMGFALAAAAAARGAEVTLVAGPCTLRTPPGVHRVDVRSAREMERAILDGFARADAVVMAAAVADYRPVAVSEGKIKKTDQPLQLTLMRNPDILAGLGRLRKDGRPVLVGFALETDNVIAHARLKLDKKGVDLIVANHPEDGFGGDENVVSLVDAQGAEKLPRLRKRAIGDRIWDRVVARLGP